MKEKITFGKNLERIRTRRGMTQAALADKLGITLAHYFYIRSGKRAPSFEVIIKAQKSLKCPYGDLFKGL